MPDTKAKTNPRVKKAQGIKKTAHVSIGVTASDKQRIIDAAIFRQQKFTEFVRESVLQAVAQVEREQTGQ
ncbi:MAG: hypothetical protein OXJ55_07155 [Caldilineaceae bacterium]|nr:hypothetical protein [Caldilineaceae bacterium]